MKLSIAVLSVAAGLAACAGKGSTDTAKQDDFSRDLQLASSTTMNLASPQVNPSLLNSLETKPQGSPLTAKTLKKGAGSRAARSKIPTVRATPEMDVAAADESSEQVNVVSTAPVPEPTNEPVAVAPRPSPVPVTVQSGDGGGDYGTSGNGGGIFGGGGGIGGVVIRGGGVDGDHCEIHGTGRGRPMPGPIYMPPPRAGGGVFGPSGGIGTSRRNGGGISRTQPVSRPSGIGISRRGR
jgi:hypothetical protein